MASATGKRTPQTHERNLGLSTIRKGAIRVLKVMLKILRNMTCYRPRIISNTSSPVGLSLSAVRGKRSREVFDLGLYAMDLAFGGIFN